MVSKSVKKDYIWNSIGSFLQSAISPVLLVVITRMNGIEDSGLFSFAMSVSIVFWAIALWGGRTYQVSDVKREFSIGGYIMVRVITALIVAVLSMVFCFASGYTATKTILILALVLFKIVESLADVVYGILQINNKLYIAGFSLFIKAISGAILFIVVNAITHDIIYSSMALLAINIAVVLFYDIPQARGVQPKLVIAINKLGYYVGEARTIMKQTAPVFVVMFLTMFSLNIPRYFLDRYHENEIGYFGIMAMPITLLALFISFVIQPNVLRLSKLLAQNKIKQFDKIVTRIVNFTLVVGVIVLLASWLAGVWVIDLVFAVNMAQFEKEFITMVVGAIFGAITSIYVNVLIIAREFNRQFYVLLLTTILLVILSPVLVEQYAMLGGVVIFMIINAIQAVIIGLIYKNKKNRLLGGV